MFGIWRGVLEFESNVFTRMEEIYKKLAKGQDPEILFITCADSRIEPERLTQTPPGKLFVLRNVGNIVPPGQVYSSEKAGIVYALEGLPNVKNIIICGHSDCGAMKGLLNPGLKERLPDVAECLTHAYPALERLNSADENDFDVKVRKVTMHNILVQIEHLKTHPAVAKKLANNELTIHGWYFDVGNGKIYAYNDTSKKFIPVKDAFIQVVSAHRDKLIEQIAMRYLEPLTHPQTVKEYKELMHLFSLLEHNLQPIWSDIEKQVTQAFWSELGGRYPSDDELRLDNLLEQGCQFKLPKLKEFQKNVMESAGYQQYMSNAMRHTLFAPTRHPLPLPITINLPSSFSLNLEL